ncbi:hypothetical protein V6N13_011850 [Hibiscus sabdariffa]|uniref:Uncharacterized protein n=1 Tax=Hibiscus sabdariffa TaxID=183260 RepID=A0ABR2SDK5_9ROSI
MQSAECRAFVLEVEIWQVMNLYAAITDFEADSSQTSSMRPVPTWDAIASPSCIHRAHIWLCLPRAGGKRKLVIFGPLNLAFQADMQDQWSISGLF